jgi:hypothetical protein
VLGLDVLLAPAEEMLWSKSFVMERERYDGGDVIHLLARARREARLAARARPLRPATGACCSPTWCCSASCTRGAHARPAWVMETMRRLQPSSRGRDVERLCQGDDPLAPAYLPDVTEWGYSDGRAVPHGNMTPEEIADWTAAISRKP